MSVDLSMPVLVVDDFSTLLRIMRTLLMQVGFQNVDQASNGPDALVRMGQRRYGLVISDWHMEPMSGYDLLCAIRSDPQLRDTPFIMVTAEAKPEYLAAAKDAGVSDYLVKPFNAQTLRTKIDSVFERLHAAPALTN